jgi:Zn-dependent protease with chaperone function
MRFFHWFLLAGAIWAGESARAFNAMAQDFVACSKPALSPSPSSSSPLPGINDALLSTAGSSAQTIFKELVQTYRSAGLPVPRQLVISAPGSHANAYVKGPETIVITPPLVAALQESSDLWFVLAHEMAHIALRHPQTTSQPMEAQADALAMQIIRERGINPCSALHVLEILQLREPHFSDALAYRRHRMQTLLGDRCLPRPRVLISLDSRSLIQ